MHLQDGAETFQLGFWNLSASCPKKRSLSAQQDCKPGQRLLTLVHPIVFSRFHPPVVQDFLQLYSGMPQLIMLMMRWTNKAILQTIRNLPGSWFWMAGVGFQSFGPSKQHRSPGRCHGGRRSGTVAARTGDQAPELREVTSTTGDHQAGVATSAHAW